MTRRLGSKYVLETALGRGATGEVWRGRSEQDGTELAFKVLHDTLARDPETVRRFIQESAILVRIEHPNLVRVHDLVVEGDTLALVMDLVAGRDLRGVLREYGNLPPAEACRIAADTALGLAAVHEPGIVHRDIKPENVLLDLRQSPPAVRLTDFGIARIAEQSGNPTTTMLVGTPQYIAPEVYKGQPPTPASDLYALGIMLYELCCGVTPFAGGTTFQILSRHTGELPGRPDGIPDPLWDYLAALLNKGPEMRPGPAAAVAQHLAALEHGLRGVPAAPTLTAPPPSVPTVHEEPTQGVNVLGQPTGPTGPTGPAGPDGPTGLTGPDGGYPPPRRRGGRRAAVALGLAVLLVGGGAGAWAALGHPLPSSAGSPATATSHGPAGALPAGPATSAAPAPSGTPTVTVTNGLLPNLVGLSVDQVKALLPQVNIETDLTSAPSGTPDGVVLGQDPAAGTAIPAAVHLTVASSRAVAYLADMTPTTGELRSGDDGQGYELSGTPQLHALGTNMDCATEGSAEYDLGSHYSTLTGVVGIDDNSADAGAKVTVEFFGDQHKITSVSASLGKPAQLNVDVTGVLRLSIRWTGSVSNSCGGGGSATLVFGNAQLTAALGYLPTPTPTPSDGGSGE